MAEPAGTEQPGIGPAGITDEGSGTLDNDGEFRTDFDDLDELGDNNFEGEAGTEVIDENLDEPDDEQGDEKVDDEGEETPKLILGKFKSHEDLEKAYSELEKQNTKISQNFSQEQNKFQQYIDQLTQQQAPKGETAEERAARSAEMVRQFYEDPEGFILSVTEKGLSAHEQAEVEFAGYIDKASDEAVKAIDEQYKNVLDDEVVAERAKLIENDPVIQHFFNQVTSKNFKELDKTGQAFGTLKFAYDLATKTAIANLHSKKVEAARATARRGEKGNQLKKNRLASNGSPIRSGNTRTHDAESQALLDAIESART